MLKLLEISQMLDNAPRRNGEAGPHIALGDRLAREISDALVAYAAELAKARTRRGDPPWSPRGG
jgi:hypothetical protein